MLSATGVLLVCVGVVLGCSPEGWVDRTVVQRILQDDVSLYGKIIQHYPDDRFPGDDVFTAEMEVMCVLKGPESLREHRLVNISEAGFVPGMCHSTTLDVGKMYIVTLYDAGEGVYRPVDHELEASQHLQEASQACGLEPFVPAGVDVNMCPPIADPDTCVGLPEPPKDPEIDPIPEAESEQDAGNSAIQMSATLSLITMATMVTMCLAKS